MSLAHQTTLLRADSLEAFRARQIAAHYNEPMAAKTIHVFPSNGSWELKREGKSAEIFVTKREAVDAARKTVREDGAGQFVVHGQDGQIRQFGAYRMTPVQNPPQKSSRAPTSREL